jgi:hypothetical protein
MKISLAFAALIVAGFVALGWPQQAAVNRLRDEHAALAAEAAALGLATEDAAAGQTRRRSAARVHLDREGEAKTIAADFVQFSKAMKANTRVGPDPDALERISGILDRLYRLDAGQVRIVLAELRNSTEIDADARRKVVGFAIMSLADSHPESAAAVFAEGQDLLNKENGGSARYIIGRVLGAWAAKDPMAALKWLRENGTRYPEWLSDDDTKSDLIAGAARHDPKAAFQLITELEMPMATMQVVRTATTADAQRAMLTCLRELANSPGGSLGLAAAYSALADRMAEQGYDATNAWLAAAKPSPEECVNVASSLEYRKTKADSGKWLEWMGQHLPPEKMKENIIPLMTDWTTQDHRAAGDWLATTPDSAAKRAAVVGYAKTVAPYEPATAVQWAESLPADSKREELLHQIHYDWKERDPAAAAAFAKKHGIEP